MRYFLKWAGSGALTASLAAGFIAYWIPGNDCDRSSPVDPIIAITYCEYGGPEVLKLERIEKPIPTERRLSIGLTN